ncbi:MAG: DsbE family thiol:disulfide interchange protein [Alphaproteobacteria bacterium]|nr:DsbE family thiol:disulfide interchange protein [Alphaproteobacteria bacterium]
MTRVVFLLPLVLFAVVAGYFAVPLLTGRDPGELPSALIDRPVPDMALPPLFEGAPGLGSDDLRGGVTLVNFFASWCVPCRAEHPVLTRLAQSETLHGISYKDDPARTREWLAELGDPFERIGTDTSGRAAIEWGVYGVPETYIIDRDGRIRYRHAGPVTRTVLEDEILPLLRHLREAES